MPWNLTEYIMLHVCLQESKGNCLLHEEKNIDEIWIHNYISFYDMCGIRSTGGCCMLISTHAYWLKKNLVLTDPSEDSLMLWVFSLLGVIFNYKTFNDIFLFSQTCFIKHLVMCIVYITSSL